MSTAPPRHRPSASQTLPKSGPGSVLTAQVPPAVNRKKAKRRAKEAAKKAAEQGNVASLDAISPTTSNSVRNGTAYDMPGAFEQNNLDAHEYPTDEFGPDDGTDDLDGVDGDYYYSEGEGGFEGIQPNPLPKSKRKKKKKTKSGPMTNNTRDTYYDPHHPYTSPHPPPPPPGPPLGHAGSHRPGDERIWSKSGQEEREHIKEFWLSLEESERRSLVKVEKEAVLKKMKEQQKHSCSCSVCGRKRTAIEEELEVLYDAYYEELEQYANHRVVLEDGTVITGPEAARAYPPVPSRLPPFVGQNGPQSRFQEEPMDEEDDLEGEEFYSEEEYDDDYDDVPPPHANDFFNFGNSLTVQGGILTVADDLLKNDGKKFIEMMEQLAERRMRREEHTHYSIADGSGHLQNQQYDDDEGYDDDEYATDDDEYPEDEEQDEAAVSSDPAEVDDLVLTYSQEIMTEEQRMEEGRRMFQIFAARMFEQRVLTAYREKVARERQDKLLLELEDEKDRDAEKEAAKARKSAKNKEKKARQKQLKEEEKAKKDAERQAAEDAARAEEERKAEEQRKKREELKKKKDEEKKRLEEEKSRKEEEKKRKLAEAKKLREEAERKQREQKEKERIKREEIRRKELEEKAAKEKEMRQRRDREMSERKEREARAKADKQAAQQARRTEQSKATPGTALPQPPLLHKQVSNVSPPAVSNLQANAHASPHLQIATPVVPKAPSPGRPRQASQQGSSIQGSHQSSPKSAQLPSGSSATSPSTSQQAQISGVQHAPPKSAASNPSIQSLSHDHNLPLAPPPGMPFPPALSPGLHMNGFAAGFTPQPNQHQRIPPPHDPMFSGHSFGNGPYRSFSGPNGAPYPSGINGGRPLGSGPPPGISPVGAASPPNASGMAFGIHSHNFQSGSGQRTQPHSRQASATIEKIGEITSSAPAQPIAPPAPIKRPSSGGKSGDKVDKLSQQLGSSALLDDDAPAELPTRDPHSVQAPFSASMFQDTFRATPTRGGFGSPGIGPFHPNYATPMSTGGWAGGPAQSYGGPFGAPRHHARPVWLRLMLIEACNRLGKSPHTQNSVQGGFHSIESLTKEVNAMSPPNEPPVPQQELLDICDTEGNHINGGGTFVRNQGNPGVGSSVWIKFEQSGPSSPGPRHSVGDIGSPIIGHSTPSFAVAPGFATARPFAPAPGGPGF